MTNPSESSDSESAVSLQRRSWPRRALNRMEVDRAVFFAVAQRGWQFLAGPITLVLIAKYFTAEMQGYYYTFWGIVGLQTFFELALPQTIITTASHQWRHLNLGAGRKIQGDPDALARLRHLTQTSFLVVSASAAAFFVGVGIFGLWFFAADGDSHAVAWRAPWVLLMSLSAIAFLTTPFLAILEGCNRVSEVYQLQFVRSVVGNLVVWVAIPLGFGLWIPALATLLRLLCEMYFIVWRYREFFRSMRHASSDARIDWRSEVWPFQSRVLLKGMLSYFNADLMAPVIFRYHGAVLAGELGMTLQILFAVRAACSSWVRARYTQMGMLVAGGEYQELDRVFMRVAKIGLAVMAIAGLGYFLAILMMTVLGSEYGTRLLPAMPTAILLIGLQAALTVEFLWTYIHSHRVSPHLWLTVLGSLLSGVLIWWWGARYDHLGVTAAYAVVQAGLYLPLSIWAWRRIRKNRGNAGRDGK